MNAPLSTTVAATVHPADTLRAAIIGLAQRASIEMSAKKATEVAAWAALLPPGTDVFIAWVPWTPPAQLVQVAVQLRAAGLNPVPHIAARQLASESAAEDFVARLRGEANVTDVLVIAGDGTAPRGPYASSIALLQTELLAKQGIQRIGIAGYPEGHPAMDDATLLSALRAKVVLAEQQGLALRIVSQFCFDGGAAIAWLRRLRSEGIVAPVHVGVAGPASLRTLINYGLRCGVGNSLRALGTHGQSLAKLLTQQGPEAVVATIAPEAEALSIAGLHLFAFGGLPRSAQWLGAVREGRFALLQNQGFRVEA